MADGHHRPTLGLQLTEPGGYWYRSCPSMAPYTMGQQVLTIDMASYKAEKGSTA